VIVNARRVDTTTSQNMCLGGPKHQGPLLGATLHWRNGPGRSCKLVDNATTSQNTLSRRPRSTQHPKRIFFRIPSYASQQERIKAAQDLGVAPQGWRAIASQAQVAAPLTQHTSNDQSAGSSPMGVGLWLAVPPPRANHASSMCLSVPVERRASWLIQLEFCFPLQPRTEKTFKPPVI
jgi:hypothetical protein